MSKIMIEKLNKAVHQGQLEFWGAVAKEFPEIKTGDFAPDAHDDFTTACGIAVVRWVGANSCRNE